MKALTCLKEGTLFSARYWFNLGGQETLRHGCKNVGSVQTNKMNYTLISNFCCSCVRLLVHKFP